MSLRILGEDLALQDRPRSEREHTPDFLERHVGPVKVACRLGLVDDQIAGVNVPAGTIATARWSAAGNDPLYFDPPEKFHIDRPGVRNGTAASAPAGGPCRS
jgi:cytochrome P450